MKPASAAPAPTVQSQPTSSATAWRERSGRLFVEFERQAKAMIRRAFRGAFSADELDDIYSNAWLGTLRALSDRHARLDDDEIRSYLLTAVAHQASKELRRRRRKPTAPLDLVGSVAAVEDGPEERLDGAERSRVARDLLTSLPPRRRAVMLLRYGWGLEPRQVCDLVSGLSPRAYRKEITRGVDELTEKMRSLERGEWCAEREPLLKAFAAGLADAEEDRQAKAHLAHCRHCSSFVARLTGNLHDLGSSAVLPFAVDGIDGQLSLASRAAELGDRARDAATGLLGRGGEETAGTLAGAGGLRGAGAAGAGIAAKLGAMGAAGKLAVACVGGGLAATACIAAGMSPYAPGGEGPQGGGRDDRARQVTAKPELVATPSPTLPDLVAAAPSPPGGGSAVQASPEPRPPEPVAEDSTAVVEPVAAETPPVEQEFGVAQAAAPVEPPAPAPASDGAEQSAVREEFAP